jgi:Tektin family
MVKNIEDVKQAIIDKERIMKVTHTRLEERLQRLGAERCRDETMAGYDDD